MNIQDFSIGDKITIDDKFYRSKKILWTLRVTAVSENSLSLSNDYDGVDHTLVQANLDYYGDAVTVVSKAPHKLANGMAKCAAKLQLVATPEKPFTATLEWSDDHGRCFEETQKFATQHDAKMFLIREGFNKLNPSGAAKERCGVSFILDDEVLAEYGANQKHYTSDQTDMYYDAPESWMAA